MNTTNLKSDTLSTAKFEQHIAQVKETIVRYRQVEQSPELQEFLALQKVVKSPEFQENKKYLLTRKYSDTEESKTTSRFRRLRIAPIVHAYYLILAYPNVKEYLEFAKSDRYALLADPQAVKQSSELKKFRFIDRSYTLRNFRRYEKSKEVQEYLRLRVVVKDEEFKKRNAFWSNSRRWYTTDESRQDARYEALKAQADIRFFLSQDPKQIAAWEQYRTLYAEEFDLANLQQTAWKAGFYYDNPNLKTDHSYTNEQQAYNHGKNSLVQNSALVVDTKKEQTTASAWHSVKGFVQQAFAWTGDVLQTGAAFRAEEGLFMAKVRVSGAAHAAVYLAAGERLPIVKLAQWDGHNFSVGVRTQSKEDTMRIQGVRPSQWYVFAVRISSGEIVWYVNNQEVLRLPNTLAGASLYPAVAEYLPQGVTAGTGKVEIDWLRVYNN